MKMLITLCLALAVGLPACKHKRATEAHPEIVVVDPKPVLPAKEPDDPKGLKPVPKAVLESPDGPDLDEAPSSECACPCPTPLPTASATPVSTPIVGPTPFPAGTILSLQAGQFQVLGLASQIPSGYGGNTTYTHTRDGVQYRIIRYVPKPSPQPSPTPRLGDYQKDPNLFATSRLPMGVDKAVASGLLTAEQVAAIEMDEILKLFIHDDDDGGPNHHMELAYMLQRYVVDGFLRGVNMIAIIKSQSDPLRLSVENLPEYSSEPNGVAVGEKIRFGNNFWEMRDTPFYSKLRTFYHELGHALLERGHICGMTMMHYPSCSSDRPFPRGTYYDPLLDEMFNPANWANRGKPLEGGARPNCPLTGC